MRWSRGAACGILRPTTIMITNTNDNVRESELSTEPLRRLPFQRKKYSWGSTLQACGTSWRGLFSAKERSRQRG